MAPKYIYKNHSKEHKLRQLLGWFNERKASPNDKKLASYYYPTIIAIVPNRRESVS